MEERSSLWESFSGDVSPLFILLTLCGMVTVRGAEDETLSQKRWAMYALMENVIVV